MKSIDIDYNIIYIDTVSLVSGRIRGILKYYDVDLPDLALMQPKSLDGITKPPEIYILVSDLRPVM